MNENEMDYRGSKSVFNNTVKEQRVDGNWCKKPLHLRCTLMDCESSYQISIPSKQIFIHTTSNSQIQVNSPLLNRYFHTNSKKIFIASPSKYQNQINSLTKSTVIKSFQKLDPWFLSGFTDGEGCFGLYIYSNTTYKIGWYVFLDFKFTLHKKDKDLLDQIKIYFGAGEISKHGEHTINYGIRSIKDLQLIINHFDKFSLKTKKLNDYKLFKLAYDMIIKKRTFNKIGY
jgi:hypothetical protein